MSARDCIDFEAVEAELTACAEARRHLDACEAASDLSSPAYKACLHRWQAANEELTLRLMDHFHAWELSSVSAENSAAE